MSLVALISPKVDHFLLPQWKLLNGCSPGLRVTRPVARAGLFSDRNHSPRCCVCPMKSAQHPGITMRGEQF